MCFATKKQRQFHHYLETLFPAQKIYYLLSPSPDAVTTVQRQYTHALYAAGLGHQVGLIDNQRTGLLHYLSVRNNLYINGRRQPQVYLPEWLRPSAPDLELPAERLSPALKLQLQFYRGLMGKRRYLIMRGLEQVMDAEQTREFLAQSASALRHSASSLLVLTTDHSLERAHPTTTFSTPPDLTWQNFRVSPPLETDSPDKIHRFS